MALLNEFRTVNVCLPNTVNSGSNEIWQAFVVPAEVKQGEITEAWYTSGTTVGADANNNAVISVYNATQSLSMASAAGTSAFTADTPRALTLSTTVANKKFVGGDKIEIRKTENGTGAAVTTPASVTITYKVNSTVD